jgi:hypothetical protein
MKIIKKFQSRDNTKNALIGLSDEIFIVEFYEFGKRVGEIEYTDKSYHYVEDAAENWTTGVMTKETIKHYNKKAA